jgi:trehalose 6-phosphate phosphatase
MLEGKMVVELIASARTKGHALTVFMAQPPFAGRTPIAIGDDRTDEDAFAAAHRLGGSSVLVGSTHASVARYTLAGPTAVTAWLESSVQQ